MIHAPDLPAWAAILTALFLLFGAVVTAIGSVGLLRFGSFYDRVHAPTLGATLGTGGILTASMICFSVLGTRLVIHEILIGLFVTVTTPVTLMLLARAALYRDRTGAPGSVPVEQSLPKAEGGQSE
jgi:multicomponent K+:H+ antiporter subunit G